MGLGAVDTAPAHVTVTKNGVRFFLGTCAGDGGCNAFFALVVTVPALIDGVLTEFHSLEGCPNFFGGLAVKTDFVGIVLAVVTDFVSHKKSSLIFQRQGGIL